SARDTRLPLRLRRRQPGARRRGGDVGPPAAGPGRHRADARAPDEGRAAVSVGMTSGRRATPRVRLPRPLTQAGAVLPGLVPLIASLASFAVGRMRLGQGSPLTSAAVLTNASLITYAIPASFLIFPFHRIMHDYGLSNDPWAVIAAQVTFATPFAILTLRQYA